MKILIIAAHPDDETLGAVGAIQNHVEQKDEVFKIIGERFNVCNS
tara:strand:+ start:3286 stop:3420 length:135 start_codon:yes stop_codon:yes gene_type:complete